MPKRIAYTVGEPAGIGADIILDLAQAPFQGEVVAFGDMDHLRQRAELLGLNIKLVETDLSAEAKANGQGQLSVYHLPMPDPKVLGKPNAANRKAVLNSLVKAYDVCQAHICDALVTGPVSKAELHTEQEPFSGHTEFFAQKAGVHEYMMAFHTPRSLIGMVTSHIPLNDVAKHITPTRIEQCIRLLQHSLQHDFAKPNPRIAILGLNPHAGENGQLGNEEIKIIMPVIQALSKQGFDLAGPIAGDTAFIGDNLIAYDGFIGMYHDQTLGPLKALNFGQLVNVTLGLPIIRTSVDHGTAYNLAGSGKAHASGLKCAIELAFKLAYHKQHYVIPA